MFRASPTTTPMDAAPFLAGMMIESCMSFPVAPGERYLMPAAASRVSGRRWAWKALNPGSAAGMTEGGRDENDYGAE